MSRLPIKSLLKEVGKQQQVGTKRKCTISVPAQVLVKVLASLDEMHKAFAKGRRARGDDRGRGKSTAHT